jgi:hypothetical protein
MTKITVEGDVCSSPYELSDPIGKYNYTMELYEGATAQSALNALASIMKIMTYDQEVIESAMLDLGANAMDTAEYSIESRRR